jgi:hypothetical protein
MDNGKTEFVPLGTVIRLAADEITRSDLRASDALRNDPRAEKDYIIAYYERHNTPDPLITVGLITPENFQAASQRNVDAWRSVSLSLKEYDNGDGVSTLTGASFNKLSVQILSPPSDIYNAAESLLPNTQDVQEYAMQGRPLRVHERFIAINPARHLAAASPGGGDIPYGVSIHLIHSRMDEAPKKSYLGIDIYAPTERMPNARGSIPWPNPDFLMQEKPSPHSPIKPLQPLKMKIMPHV